MTETQQNFEIRPALPIDEDEIFFLLVEMAAENSNHAVNVAKSILTIRDTIQQGGVFVAVLEGKIIGSAGVSPQSSWFSNAVFLGDSWFYVSPGSRGLRVAMLLKKKLIEYAERAKLDLVCAVFSTTDAERKGQFFARDMEFLGGAYTYKVKEE